MYPKLKILLGNNYIHIQGMQLYRLVTCMFLHGDILHLLFNMYALYILGSQVERYYGKRRFLLIYFINFMFHITLFFFFKRFFNSARARLNGQGITSCI